MTPAELANVLVQESEGTGTPEGYEIEEDSGIVKPYKQEQEEAAAAPISDMALEAFLLEVAESEERLQQKRIHNKNYNASSWECA